LFAFIIAKFSKTAVLTVATLGCAMEMSESPLIHHLTHYLTHFTSIREAWIIFKAGKNCDGFFDVDDLLQQVDYAIDIFEGLVKGQAQGLFLFDNISSHQKRAPDTISAQTMVKGAHSLSCFLPPTAGHLP